MIVNSLQKLERQMVNDEVEVVEKSLTEETARQDDVVLDRQKSAKIVVPEQSAHPSTVDCLKSD
jgi:hypothetical protein